MLKNAKMRSGRKVTYYPLMGGEDLVTPLYSRKPGSLVGSANFECDAGGRYARVAGYERFDGRPAPSDASYWVISFDTGTVEVAADSTVTGATSTAYGTALIAGVLESGTYAGGDAAGYIVLYNVSGTFQSAENLNVSGSPVCVSTSTAGARGASTTALDTTYYRAAVAATRADIAAVTGSGDILGVHYYNNVAYAFRNNAAGTAAVMFKSSTSGWTAVDLGYLLNFDTGSVTFTAGDTVTGGATGHTADVMAVVVTSGTWAGGNAAGYLVIHNPTGVFQNNEALTSAAGVAVADGTATAITLTASGRYEFVNYNFGGHASTLKMYGCDGKNEAFEFDGTSYVPLTTGMTTDTPEHIIAHKKHLFLSFSGGSVQHSTIGNPYEWSAVTGASEIGLGVEITGFSKIAGDLLAVFGLNAISIISGSAASGDDAWVVKSFSQQVGAIEWSLQNLFQPIFMTATGLMAMGAVEAYGDFEADSLSEIIEPFFTSYTRGDFTASIKVRTKGQYRIFFDDNTGLNLTFNGTKVMGLTRLAYAHKVACTCSELDNSGNEVLLFGSEDGYVFRLDKGTSFDGEAINALFKTSINTIGYPENKKRFFKLVLERNDLLEEAEWDLGTWDNFKWDEENEERDESYLDETGTGYDYVYVSSSAYLEQFVIQGIILHYSIGGLSR